MLNRFKDKAAEQDKSTAPHGLEFVRPQRSVADGKQAADRVGRRAGRLSAKLNAMVQRMSSAESKASCALRIL